MAEISKTQITERERNLEAVAMNIVHQLGDALYEALPKDIAHNHFVDARQKTNDLAIDFAKKLVNNAIVEAEDKIFNLLLSRYSDVTLRDYGGNERLILQIVSTDFIANYWASIKNDRNKGAI